MFSSGGQNLALARAKRTGKVWNGVPPRLIGLPLRRKNVNITLDVCFLPANMLPRKYKLATFYDGFGVMQNVWVQCHETIIKTTLFSSFENYVFRWGRSAPLPCFLSNLVPCKTLNSYFRWGLSTLFNVWGVTFQDLHFRSMTQAIRSLQQITL